MSESEPIDAQEVVRHLNETLKLQYRSIIQLTLAAGSLAGIQYQFVAHKLAEFAAAEVVETERIVSKIVSLAGEPTTEVAEVTFSADPREMLRMISQTEQEILEAVAKAIPPTGTEATGEAVEHLVEHVLLRKHDQIDWLLRAQTS